MTRRWPIFGFVALVTFVAFLPALRNGLLRSWDDAVYITDNVHIRTLSLETVRWAFTEFHARFWAPLLWLSLAVDHAFWGIDPFGYHLVNVLLHALNAGLFFLVAVELQVRPRAGSAAPARERSALLVAALAALLFALHPLRVESVAWATERKDVLSGLLGLGAVLAWLAHARREEGAARRGSRAGFLRSGHYWVALALLAASLLAKPTFVTLPVVLLVMDWFPLRRLARGRIGGLLLEKVPFLVLSLASSIVTIVAMAPSLQSLETKGVGERAVVAIAAIGRYVWLTVVPEGISPVYFHAGPGPLRADQWLSIAISVAFSGWALAGARRRPAVLAAWVVFAVTLSPVLGVVQNGLQEIAAHFTYVPSLSISLLAAIGVGVAFERLSDRPRAARAVLVAAVASTVALAAVTVRDIGHWRDDIAFWSRVIEVQPQRFGKAYKERAVYLALAGRYPEALADVDEAIAIASKKNHPDLHEVYAQRARIYRGMRDYGNALADLSRAIALSPPGWTGMYHWERAGLLLETGDVERAKQDFAAAEALRGGIPGAGPP